MTSSKQSLQDISDRNYTYSRKLSEICSFEQYKNKHCFIIGGGESLEGFDFGRIKDEFTIGINKSFLYFNSTFLYVADTDYYTEIQNDADMVSKWREFNGIKVMPSPQIEHTIPDCYVVRRNNLLTIPTSFNDGINPGNNSGFGALMLAISLGFSIIYLLGYDLKCQNRTHWHEGYQGQKLECQNQKLHSFLTPFILLSSAIKRHGTIVINLNPESALPCFHKKTIDEILN